MRRTKVPARSLLTPEQELQVQRILAAKQAERPLSGYGLACRIGGTVTAARRGSIGNSAYGWSLHGHRGAQAIKAHRYLRNGDG